MFQMASQEELLMPLSVTFTGESAVDDGGPRRELGSIIMQHVARSGLLNGWYNAYICKLLLSQPHELLGIM